MRTDSDVKPCAPAERHHHVVCVTACDIDTQTMSSSTNESSSMTSLMCDVNAHRHDSAALTSTADATRDTKQVLALQADVNRSVQ